MKPSSPSRAEVLGCLTSFGTNSNSFLLLYPGFRYYRARTGHLLGYVETPTTWVAATEPLGHESGWEAAWRELSERAAERGKSVVVLPVGERGLRAAERAGFGSLMIGAEPKFDLETYAPSLDTVHSARVLADKGASVREFRPAESEAIRRECDAITEEWLRGRPLTPLDFLNRVTPWEAGEHKRYFLVEQGERILAFLAAVPAFAAKSWYFIDVLRRDRSPAGSTELLALEAMRLLKETGAREISLGVSPLSQLERADQGRHPYLYPTLTFVFRRLRLFYRFKPLYEYKLKFRPSRWEPAYLVYSPPTLTPGAALGLLRTMMGTGVIASALSTIPRVARRFDGHAWIRGRLSSLVLARALPDTTNEAVRRSIGSIALTVLLLAFSGTTAGPQDALGKLLPLAACGPLFEWLGGTEMLLLCFLVPAGLVRSLWGGVLGVSGGLSAFLRPLPALAVTALTAAPYFASGSSWHSMEIFCLAWLAGFLCSAIALGRFSSILRRQPL